MDSREAELSRVVGSKIREALDAEAAAGDDIRLGRMRFIDRVTARQVSHAFERPRAWTVTFRRLSFGMVGAAAAVAAVADGACIDAAFVAFASTRRI